MTLSFVNNLEELGKLLKLLRESGVKVLKVGDTHILMDDEYEEVEDGDNNTREPTNAMGFDTTDLRGLGIATDFDQDND